MTIHNVTGVPMSDWATKRRWWCFFSHTCIQNKTEPYPNVDRISDVCCQIVIESYIGSFFPLTRTNSGWYRHNWSRTVELWTSSLYVKLMPYLPCVQIPLKIGTIDTVCENCVNCGVDLETIHSNTLETRTDPIENAMLKNFSSTTATTTTTTTTNYCTVLYGILVRTFNDKINEWKQENNKHKIRARHAYNANIVKQTYSDPVNQSHPNCHHRMQRTVGIVCVDVSYADDTHFMYRYIAQTVQTRITELAGSLFRPNVINNVNQSMAYQAKSIELDALSLVEVEVKWSISDQFSNMYQPPLLYVWCGQQMCKITYIKIFQNGYANSGPQGNGRH